MIHVGNALSSVEGIPENQLFYRKNLLSGRTEVFRKHDIVNADTQMHSVNEAGVEVDYGHLSARKSPWSLLRAGRAIRRVSASEDVDLLHVLWGSTTGLLTTFFSKKPVVISFCGSDLLGNKNERGRLTAFGRINRFLSRWASRRARYCITKSEQMRRMLPPSVRQRTTAIPNGVNLKGFFPMEKEKARQHLGWDQDKSYVLYFYTPGQVVKNPRMARAVRDRLLRENRNLGWIEATGIAHEELVYYYNASDVMILTSFHEGSNNSLKEAMACNCPIVSVPAGDAEERLKYVSPGGVVPAYDVDTFAGAVQRVLELDRRSNGSDYASAFSLECVAQQVVSVYEKALKK